MCLAVLSKVHIFYFIYLDVHERKLKLAAFMIDLVT